MFLRGSVILCALIIISSQNQKNDGRRLEVVADGLALWRGVQLAIDTTLVSPLHQDGSPRTPPMEQCWRRFASGRNVFQTARLVVLAPEVGGRWLDETAQFLQGLAKARAHAVDPSRACGSRMDSTLELHLGLQHSACIRDVPVGAPTNNWH